MKKYFYPSSKMSVNSVNRLCFPTDIDFTPGEWEAIIGSQYTPTYHLYKKERYGYLTSLPGVKSMSVGKQRRFTELTDILLEG